MPNPVYVCKVIWSKLFVHATKAVLPIAKKTGVLHRHYIKHKVAAKVTTTILVPTIVCGYVALPYLNQQQPTEIIQQNPYQNFTGNYNEQWFSAGNSGFFDTGNFGNSVSSVSSVGFGPSFTDIPLNEAQPVQAIPEPSSLIIFGFFLFALFFAYLLKSERK